MESGGIRRNHKKIPMTELQQNYVRENHKEMTVKQMQTVLRIDPTKIYKYMGENGLEVKRLKPGKKLRVWVSEFYEPSNICPITGFPISEIDMRKIHRHRPDVYKMQLGSLKAV